MPVYEYICKHCGHGFDRILPHEHADTPGDCPSCGNGEVRRRFSRVAVRYGGWGFSSTDGLVPDRPGRGDFRSVQERAERISEGDTGSPMHD
jgi:putative FmdB family regulatory protein